MTTYELGGIKFIVHDGEVYCKYTDVFETDENEVEQENSEEQVIEEESIAPTLVIGRKNKCGLCGGFGHSKRTCIANDDDEPVDRKLQAQNAIQLKINNLVRQGASDEEIYAAMHDSMTDSQFREAITKARE